MESYYVFEIESRRVFILKSLATCQGIKSRVFVRILTCNSRFSPRGREKPTFNEHLILHLYSLSASMEFRNGNKNG